MDRAAAVGAVVLVLASALATRASGVEPSSPTGQLVCAPGRLVIQVHGTRSMGEFFPGDPRVRAHVPFTPDDDLVVHGGRNGELAFLIGTLPEAPPCVLTFSYDNEYIPVNGNAIAGVNAWNDSRSPWERQPDRLADQLQLLMDAYPGRTFDIVAYSAGGIVPTYWAARPQTRPDQRARVHSITSVDGVVNGYDIGAFNFLCAIGLASLHPPIPEFGPPPCQFRRDAEFVKTIRERALAVPYSNARAKGDLIVPWEVAGLEGRALRDPHFRAEGCSGYEWLDLIGCAMQSHNSVLEQEAARDVITFMFGPQQ